jgi:hypothetical protein
MNLGFLETLQNSSMENNAMSRNAKMPQAVTKTRIELPEWSRRLGLKYTQKVLGA